MIDQKTKKEIIGKEISNQKGSFLSSKKIIHPKRDWTILLVLLFVFYISDIIFGIYMYRKITSGNMYVTVPNSELRVEVLKTEKIHTLISDYESRKAELIKKGIKIN
jgi:hypothetical protein